MTNSFSKMIKYDSDLKFQEFIDAEIKAQPDIVKKDIFESFKSSELVKGIFLRGYMEGIAWMKANEDTKFVVGDMNE